MLPNAYPSTTLAELATTHPAASRVLRRAGLDYCCGGRRRLDEACAQHKLDPQEVLAAIAAEEEQAVGSDTGWSERPLSELVRHIVDHYHRRLRQELPELQAMALRVENRHAEKATCPHGLAEHLESMHAAVLDHLAKEESILFPLILEGRGPDANGPIHAMEREHADHADNLAAVRALTEDLRAPAEACTTWRSLYLRLGALEAELMEHIHLENNILFPRALSA